MITVALREPMILVFIISAISIVAGILELFFWGKGYMKKREQEEAAKQILSTSEAAGIANLLLSYSQDRLSAKDRQILSTIVWRYSEVPLTTVLSNPKEKHYLLSALVDPSKFPWDDEQSEHQKR